MGDSQVGEWIVGCGSSYTPEVQIVGRGWATGEEETPGIRELGFGRLGQ